MEKSLSGIGRQHVSSADGRLTTMFASESFGILTKLLKFFPVDGTESSSSGINTITLTASCVLLLKDNLYDKTSSLDYSILCIHNITHYLLVHYHQ